MTPYIKTLADHPDIADRWDAFVDTHQDGVWHHQTGWIDYCTHRIPGITNRSFAVMVEGHIRAIAVIIEEPGGVWAMGGGPLPQIISASPSAAALAGFHVGELVNRYRPTQYPVEHPHDFIPHGWVDASWQMRSIVDPVWSKVRHSYRSIIHAGQKVVELSTNPNDVAALHYLHRQESGKETRSQQTWDLMAEWIAAGHAYMVVARSASSQIIGAVYIYTYKGVAYYGHAATEQKNLNHALLWVAIEQGFQNRFWTKRFDVGWIGHAANPKEANIEFFRQGFGGSNRRWSVIRPHA